jgi:hypothetical protein
VTVFAKKYIEDHNSQDELPGNASRRGLPGHNSQEGFAREGKLGHAR